MSDPSCNVERARKCKKDGKNAYYMIFNGYSDDVLLEAKYPKSEIKEAEDFKLTSYLSKHGTSDSSKRAYVKECIKKDSPPI